LDKILYGGAYAGGAGGNGGVDGGDDGIIDKYTGCFQVYTLDGVTVHVRKDFK
jgi:hypothetical protein